MLPNQRKYSEKKYSGTGVNQPSRNRSATDYTHQFKNGIWYVVCFCRGRAVVSQSESGGRFTCNSSGRIFFSIIVLVPSSPPSHRTTTQGKFHDFLGMGTKQQEQNMRWGNNVNLEVDSVEGNFPRHWPVYFSYGRDCV